MGLALENTKNSDLFSTEKALKKICYFNAYTDDSDVLWITFTVLENAWEVKTPALIELNQFLQTLDQSQLKGIILHFSPISSRSTISHIGSTLTPINHTDVTTEAHHPDALKEHFQQGEQLYNHLQQLSTPSLAFMETSCLGAVLLIALATQKQLASANEQIRFSFPESHLGLPLNVSNIYPLLNKLGSYKALKLLLFGQQLTSQQALKLHLIDQITSLNTLKTPGKLKETLDLPKTSRKLATVEKLCHLHFTRSLINVILKKYHSHSFPMHHDNAASLLDTWLRYGKDPQNLHKKLAKSFIKQRKNSATHHMRSNFLLANQLMEPQPALQDIKEVYILGCTSQSVALTLQCLIHNIKVTLQHHPSDNTDRLLQHIDYFVNDALLQQNLTCVAEFEAQQVQNADVIIHMAADDLLTRQKNLYQLEKYAKPSALLSCSLYNGSLQQLSSHLTSPEKLLGLNFFSVIREYPLLEIVEAEQHKQEGSKPQQAYAFANTLKAIPFPVHDSPGHLIYRVTLAYIRQGIHLYQQDVPQTIIDQAGRELGMRYGPLEMADHVGLDICKQLMELMEKAQYSPPPPTLLEKLKQGHLGKKSGTGFYHYRNGKRLKQNPDQEKWSGNLDLLQTKLLHEIREEAGLCLEQGVIENSKLLDLGIVFGVGFPAALGGPLSHLQRTNRKYA